MLDPAQISEYYVLSVWCLQWDLLLTFEIQSRTKDIVYIVSGITWATLNNNLKGAFFWCLALGALLAYCYIACMLSQSACIPYHITHIYMYTYILHT